MGHNFNYKKWGILVAIFIPLAVLALFVLPDSFRGWYLPIFLVLFWGSYYSWVGLEKRKKNLAKTD